MLAIRLQRHGRKKYATYRFVVQESNRAPASGRVIAYLGNYNPHTKEINIDKEQAETYMKNGAQPSGSAAKLFKSQKVKLPSRVEKPAKQKRAVKNPEKLRKNQPAEEKQPESTDASAEDATPEAAPAEAKPEENTKAEAEAKTEDAKPEAAEAKDSAENQEESK